MGVQVISSRLKRELPVDYKLLWVAASDKSQKFRFKWTNRWNVVFSLYHL